MKKALAGICLLFGLIAAVAPGIASAARLQVQSVTVAPEGGNTRVELRLSRPADYEIFTLGNPDRVVIDIASATLAPGALSMPAAAGGVRDVRAAHRPDEKLRIVFDVAEAMRPTAVQDAATSRLTISLAPAAGSSSAAALPAAAPPTTAASTPTAPSATPAPVTAPAPATTATPSPAPAPAPVPVQPRTEIVVVVDAGHGGHDPGAHGPSGVREKDVTLAISRQLVDLLNNEPGMRGVLTRSDDRFLGLRERMERARSANAHLFISIHADAAYNRNAQGSTVYVLSEKAASDEASRRLAARENAALIGGVDLGDKDPVLASVLMDLSQNASISSSITVGEAILDNMARLGRLHRNTVQQAPFMVLKSPDVPSILVETAYISNPVDERNLNSPRHQQALAKAMLDGVKKYFAANPPSHVAKRPAIVASDNTAFRPKQHVVRKGDTLSGVASLYGVSLRQLRAANGLRSDVVRVGQKLTIPVENG